MSNFHIGRDEETRGCELQWYAAYTRHQHEKAVARIMSLKGIETFLPVCNVTSHWKDRTKILQQPLFPGYVFLRADLRRRLPILEIPSVHFLVGGNSDPAAIPVEEIEAIRRALLSRFLVEPYPFLTAGDRVRIKGGPLEGLEGILVRKKKEHRLILSVEMLQKSVAVEIDGYVVERIGPRAVAGPARSWG